MKRLKDHSLSLIATKSVGKLANFVHRNVTPLVMKKLGGMRRNSVAAYWWTGERNFGDLLTPAILQQLGYTPVWTAPEQAHFAATGSILGLLPRDYRGVIAGAGLLSKTDKVHFPDARIVALRGEDTKRLIRCTQNVVLGDPGLLAIDLLKTRARKRYTLGIVPHYEDQTNKWVHALKKKYAKDVTIINVRRNPRHVIQHIDRCCAILSSSLHGVVVADSLGIPNRWIVLSDRLYGAGFKFRDYASAFGAEISPMALHDGMQLGQIMNQMREPSKGIDACRQSLRTALSESLMSICPRLPDGVNCNATRKAQTRRVLAQDIQRRHTT